MGAPFSTDFAERAGVLVGPWRAPRQMLHDQVEGGHATIHDAGTAQALGFKSGTIEGPTHFSQFVPLLHHLWRQEWHETGCISAHFRTPAFEGDRLRAFVELPEGGARQVAVWMENEAGETVFTGTASVGVDAGPSELDQRLANLRPIEDRAILKDLHLGMKIARRRVVMGFDQPMGALYPFTLSDKLAAITEPSPWHDPVGGKASPWGRPVVPLEMISVLLKYTDEVPPFPIPGQVVSLIADQEIRLFDGPVFVGENYEIEQEVAAFSGSRRTESVWIRTTLIRPGESRPVARMMINQASFRESL